MARTAYSLNSYVGGATAATVVATGIGTTDTVMTITGTNASWTGLGATGGFYLAVDYGVSSEEKIFVPSGSWTYANTGVTLSGITRAIDGTTAIVHSGGGFVTPVITSIDTSEANQLVSLEIGNNTVRNATGVMVPGEFCIFSGTTAAQTLSLPPQTLINQTNNFVVNYSTVAVTVASGSTAQLNSFGTLGN